MRSLCIVMDAPLLDDDLGFPEAVEDFAVQQFVPELAVEGLAVAVLPGRSWLDVQAFRAQPRQPLAQDLGDHFRAIVRPDEGWDPFEQHSVSQRLNDTDGVDPPGHPDRQALAGELIDQGHQPDTTAIMGCGLDKVEAPDVVWMFRPEPDT